MSQLPTVSVIMAIRNEEGSLPHTLYAVLTQTYPHELIEVLIADGHSTDSTRAIIERLKADHRDIRVEVLDNPGLAVARGLNAAIRRSRGAIIIRVDGHTEIASDYVKECVRLLVETGADNVGGRMEAIGKGVVGKAIALATSSRFGVGGARFHYCDREEWVDTVYLGAWRRQLFSGVSAPDQSIEGSKTDIGRGYSDAVKGLKGIGLFDEELVRNQDDEFNYRLRKYGGRILLSPTIRSKYLNRSTLSSLSRQYFEYGWWKVRVLQKHPRQMRRSHFIPALFLLCLVVSIPLVLFGSIGRILVTATLGSYLVANLSASCWTGLRARYKQVHFLAMVYATMHLSYGLGFLSGLFRFAGRWGAIQMLLRRRVS